MRCARVKVVFGKKEIGLVFFFFFPPFEENAKSSDLHKNTRYTIRALVRRERKRERERDD